jgi:hypothetical protein
LGHTSSQFNAWLLFSSTVRLFSLNHGSVIQLREASSSAETRTAGPEPGSLDSLFSLEFAGELAIEVLAEVAE